MRSYLQKLVLTALVLGLVLPNLGCGSKVEGKYTDSSGLATLELKGGKATFSVKMPGGSTITKNGDYTINGDTITVKSTEGDETLKINKDGSLQGEGEIGTLKKVPS